ncbi:hypothetical protein M569_00059, partial [Genlisea aurea]
YGFLGDDLIITDESVALSYRSIMEGLNVRISDVKSLISHSGAAEFAKRFLCKNLTVALWFCPVSLKSLLGSHGPQGIYALKGMYPTLKILLRIAGAGYNVATSIST